MQLLGCVALLGNILQAAAVNIGMLLAGRVVAGLSVANSSKVYPVVRLFADLFCCYSAVGSFLL
jgi:predicted MFS family arabinose efflux permease